MLKKISQRFLLAAAVLSVAHFPAAHAGTNVSSGKDSKKVIIEEEDPENRAWHASLTAGYQSEYMFRGTNVTPGAFGLGFADLNIKIPGFARNQRFFFEAWAGFQHGSSEYPGDPGLKFGSRLPTSRFAGEHHRLTEVFTHQSAFQELDLRLAYSVDIGDYLVAELGNYAYLVTTETRTKRLFKTDPGYIFVANGQDRIVDNVVRDGEGEVEDQLYLDLRLNRKVFKDSPVLVIPSVRYYQTIYSNRDDAPYGGYLVIRIDGEFQLIRGEGRPTLSFNPYVLQSVSFEDRTKVSGGQTDFYTGWHHLAVGAEIPLHLNKNFSIGLFGEWDHMWQSTPPGTDHNEIYGGARVTIGF